MEIISNESCLVFCATKQQCEGNANLICGLFDTKMLEHRADDRRQLLSALRNETGTLCPILGKTIPFGVAYHHADLTREERCLIENACRLNILSVICCTSTLAAGVNLPAKCVIIRSRVSYAQSIQADGG